MDNKRRGDEPWRADAAFLCVVALAPVAISAIAIFGVQGQTVSANPEIHGPYDRQAIQTSFENIDYGSTGPTLLLDLHGIPASDIWGG